MISWAHLWVQKFMFGFTYGWNLKEEEEVHKLSTWKKYHKLSTFFWVSPNGPKISWNRARVIFHPTEPANFFKVVFILSCATSARHSGGVRVIMAAVIFNHINGILLPMNHTCMKCSYKFKYEATSNWILLRVCSRNRKYI